MIDKNHPGASLKNRLRRFRRAPLQVIMHRVHRYRRNLLDAPHEWRLGIRTSGVISQFIDQNEQNVRCESVSYRTLDGIGRHMTAHGITAPRFADLGAGLGRPLYFFASRFEELIGYELIAPIHAMALAEFARVRARRPEFARISFECADATTAVPLDRPLVAFLFNPFGPKPMARLCERLRRAQSDVHLYYVNPQFADVIADSVGPRADTFRSDFAVAYFHIRGTGPDAAAGPKFAPFAA
ncbi:MAG: hypothetical protein WDM91_21015 [Rhizomicrobium sp.]